MTADDALGLFAQAARHVWVSFPARSYEDPDGNIKWQALIEFLPDATRAREQFRAQAVAAIHEFIRTKTSGRSERREEPVV
jgi:hypothetical protein